MPALFPVLAIRDAVHFPGLISTLQVVREPSLKALRKAGLADQRVVILSQRDMSVQEPQPGDLFDVGILSEALQTIPLPDTSLRVALRGLKRVRARRISDRRGCFYAEIDDLYEIPSQGDETEALSRTAVDSFTRVVERNRDIPPESLEGVVHARDPGNLADSILHHLPVKPCEKQALLEELDHLKRLSETVRLLRREENILELRGHIQLRVDKELGDSQREYYLREQLRVIQSELQGREDRIGETEEYRERIEQAQMPAEATVKAMSELRRLDRTPAASPEGMVIRSYLDVLISLPWRRSTPDRLDVREAERLLNERHFGLTRVKERILDHLAVRQLKGDSAGSILCFVGPPGVGKTSIGRSIADAMERKFFRIALGGVRDEAEIRGHRRTYVGSMPGRIIQGLRDCGSRNPVVVLDEIDKLAQGPSGDPMSALLEALDPEQNRRFSDHFVEIPFDLSDTLFIATGNVLETVPSALKDRMEIIAFSGYTDDERLAIARGFLLPKVTRETGLGERRFTISDEAMVLLATKYTREAGVRELSRYMARLCQKAARIIADGRACAVHVDAENIAEYLGQPRWGRPHRWTEPETGVAWGLVVGEAGGDLISVEASLVSPSSDNHGIRLTGCLGDVMKESALAAVTYLQGTLGAPLRREVHVHVPAGGVPKDGPSAGLTMLLALASAHSGKPLKPGFATTGEITLRGRVLGVGGLRDKLLAAAAAGITDVILPQENEDDLEDLPMGARNKLRLHLVRNAGEALALVL